ncbi:MAG TPA: hypothetical protein VN711_02520 [Candidatus Saccharimonadales bacterium]|nr:hypothetical protein [Candidatus Saccharimonadales bacterium]
MSQSERSLADEARMRTHHYKALSHVLNTAEYYRQQRTMGIAREERHETLRHLATVANTTLQIEGDGARQTVGERVREAVSLVGQS